MRMWLFIHPKHLIAEHGEIHKARGFIRNGNTASLKGLIRDGFFDTRLMYRRHDQLIKELERRGFKHNSPLEPIDTSELDLLCQGIDTERSVRDLKVRCPVCAERLENMEQTGG